MAIEANSLPYIRSSQIASARIKLGDQFDILELSCGFEGPTTCVYHAKWSCRGRTGWSVAQAPDVKTAFNAVQERALLDAIGKKDIPSEIEYQASQFRFPFGHYRGKLLVEVPLSYTLYWANRNTMGFPEITQTIVEECQRFLAGDD